MALPESLNKSPNSRSIIGFLKKFNKISAAVLLSSGIVFESGALLALGTIDAAQSWGLGKLEQWNKERRAQRIGHTALSGAA